MCNDYYEPFIIDVFGEWDEYKKIIELYKINLIKKLNFGCIIFKEKNNAWFLI